LALPHHECGLDVSARVGRLRHAEHRRIPEIHRELSRRGVVLAERTVRNLLDRSDELRALAPADPQRLGPLLRDQGRVVLASDGLQPDVGPEVLWVLRACLSGDVLLATSLLSATITDLTALLTEVREALPVPIPGLVSDGQDTIRKAVAQARPGVPHPLGHFHYLREAAQPIEAADRHAKKELTKRVRGVRTIERAAEAEEEVDAEIVRGYWAAVRAAVTDDGWPALATPGLARPERREQITASLDKVAAPPSNLPGGFRRLRHVRQRGREATAALGPPVRVAIRGVKRVARLLENNAPLSVRKLRQRLVDLRGPMGAAAAATPAKAVHAPLQHFGKVTKSYRPGWFPCQAVADLPRTNHDLEHLFGRHRYQERRARGRKRASPGLVVMGSVRVVSGLATRLRPEEGFPLPAGYGEPGRQRRAELEQRRAARRQQARFRRDPMAYLQSLEQRTLQLSLPS
jgi:hypothetical protein